MTSSKSQDLFLTKFFDIYNDVDPEDDEDDQQQERIWNFTKPENVKRLLLYFVCSNDGDSVLKILHTFEVMQPMGMYLLSPAAIIMGRKRDPMSLEFKDMLMKIYGKRVFEMHQDTLDIETLVQTCCETSPCMCEPYESSELKHVSQVSAFVCRPFADHLCSGLSRWTRFLPKTSLSRRPSRPAVKAAVETRAQTSSFWSSCSRRLRMLSRKPC